MFTYYSSKYSDSYQIFHEYGKTFKRVSLHSLVGPVNFTLIVASARAAQLDVLLHAVLKEITQDELYFHKRDNNYLYCISLRFHKL